MSEFDDRMNALEDAAIKNAQALQEMLINQQKRMRQLAGEPVQKKIETPTGTDMSVIDGSAAGAKAGVAAILDVLQPNRAGSAALDAARKQANEKFNIESIGAGMTKDDVTIASASILSVLRENGFRG